MNQMHSILEGRSNAIDVKTPLCQVGITPFGKRFDLYCFPLRYQLPLAHLTIAHSSFNRSGIQQTLEETPLQFKYKKRGGAGRRRLFFLLFWNRKKKKVFFVPNLLKGESAAHRAALGPSRARHIQRGVSGHWWNRIKVPARDVNRNNSNNLSILTKTKPLLSPHFVMAGKLLWTCRSQQFLWKKY